MLTDMDDIYSHLVTMDFPDTLTRGLRRTTDMVRGVTERTRGDLTTAVRENHAPARAEENSRSVCNPSGSRGSQAMAHATRPVLGSDCESHPAGMPGQTPPSAEGGSLAYRAHSLPAGR